MTIFPIVERELRVAARKAPTYYARLIGAAVATLVLATFLWQIEDFSGAFQPGPWALALLTSIAFFFCLFEGARHTADCLSEEKREGTLGLLFLTDLNGHDVVLGKLASSALTCTYGLLAVVPLLGITLLLGGVTGAEFARLALALVNALFFSAALGMWISARSRQENRAFAAAATLLAVITFGTPIVDALLIGESNLSEAILTLTSPGYACYMGFEAEYATAAERYWISLAVVHAAGWMLLALAGIQLQRHWQADVGQPPVAPHPLRRGKGAQGKRRERVGDQAPMYWLVRRGIPHRLAIWLVFLLSRVVGDWEHIQMVSGFMAMDLQMVFVFLGLGLAICAHFLPAYVAARCFVEARRNGALELLLTTPLSVGELVRGQTRALTRILGGPVLAVVAWDVMMMWGAWYKAADSSIVMGSGQMNYTTWLIWSKLGEAVTFVLDVVALCWVAMWLALVSPKPGQAAARAFVRVIIVPGFALYPVMWMNWETPWVAASAEIIIMTMFSIWARRRLLERMREAAAG
ncbi:MAG: ABC transporter permease subunit [Verrucomicrobiota bacterium]